MLHGRLARLDWRHAFSHDEVELTWPSLLEIFEV